MLLMFRSRKTHLVKRAWKARKNGFVNSCEELRRQQREAEQLQKGVAMQLLRRLTVPQLELLVPALESGGADPGECVLVTRNNNTQEGEDGIGGESTTFREQYSPSPPPYTLRPPSLSPSPSANLLPLPPPPHLVMLWLWRWPDLFFSHQHQKQHAFGGADFDCYDTSLIQNLPWCAARNDHVYVCANPYHWARIDSPPPPYSRFNIDLLKPEDAAPSEDEIIESQETGGTYQYGSYSNNGPGTIPWCKVAYWEGRTRVGRLYEVRTPSLNIMGNTPHGDGLCIASLTAGPDYTPSEQAKKIKEKIGLGLVLYQDAGGVWVYNRADIPLFVNSPTLDGGIHPRSNFKVHKLPPGHIINIFDYDKARIYQRLPLHPDLKHEGPIDHNSVRLSFVKGWGQNYHRQEITECPCWLEILLVPVR